MSKDSYWFRHDSNASRDIKMLKLRYIYGFWGQGVFWGVIEALRENEGYKWDSDESSLQLLCGLIDCRDESKFLKFIKDCVKIGLLVEKKGKIYSESLNKRMLRWESSKKNGKKGGRPQGEVGEKTIYSLTGKKLPRETEGHCIYLMKDTKHNTHKIGETRDIFKRRLSVKVPKNQLQVVDFQYMADKDAQQLETDIKEYFKSELISGDWLDLNPSQVQELLEIMSAQKIPRIYPDNSQNLPKSYLEKTIREEESIEEENREDNKPLPLEQSPRRGEIKIKATGDIVKWSSCKSAYLKMLNDIRTQFKPNAKGFEKLSATAEQKLRARLVNDGYTSKDFKHCMVVCFNSDFHASKNYKNLTAEFFTRESTLERYLYQEIGDGNETTSEKAWSDLTQKEKADRVLNP